MAASSFEEVIAEKGRLVYTNVGDSMYPLIRPRDLLIIDAVTRPLRLWDVPLYKRDSGQYVLHRIVKIKNGSYVMCGDNRCTLEYGITDRHIIGVLTGIVRDGRTLPVTMPEHKSILFRKIKR
ncbi:MAG: S24/S26 family peptidase, partial [Ruminococcus sp.]|nr:S24/S26 family peptidase [Ruminococcus sp.]